MADGISKADLASLNNTIQRTIKASKKSITGAMIQASVFASTSAAVATPQAKKNRVSKRIRAKRVRGNRSRAKKGIPWWAVGSVEIWKKGKMKNTFFLKDKGFQRARATPRRGLAKLIWKATGSKRIAMVSGSRGLQERFATNKTQTIGGMLTSIVMTNELNYISKIAPNSARIGVQKADARLQGILNRKLARDIEKAFQRGR